MSEDLALLDAIAANPSDDLPRLVYADWLDEHDEPELAAFVRLQVMVYRTPSADPRRTEIRSRENAAWKAYQKKWGGDLRRYGLGKPAFSRGLIERAVRVPASEFVAPLVWRPGCPFRRVHIPDPTGFAAAIAGCPFLPYLRGLLLGPPDERIWRHTLDHPYGMFDRGLRDDLHFPAEVFLDFLRGGVHRPLRELHAGFLRASPALLQALLATSDLLTDRHVTLVVTNPAGGTWWGNRVAVVTTDPGRGARPFTEQVRAHLVKWFAGDAGRTA